MNKKDVLGASAAAWNVQKMESMPHGLSAGNAQKPALHQLERREVLARLCYLIPCIQPGIEFANQLRFCCVRYQNDIKCCTGNIL